VPTGILSLILVLVAKYVQQTTVLKNLEVVYYQVIADNISLSGDLKIEEKNTRM
jgi:hypothetical protein